MMMWTNDPVYDAERYAAERDAEISKLPRCGFCGERITSETALLVGEKLMCDDCRLDATVYVEDYVA